MNFPLYICCFVCLIRASTSYLNHFRSWTWHFWRSKRRTPRGISTWRSVEQYGKKSWTHNRQSSSAKPVVIVFPEVEWPSYQNHWWFTAYCSLWSISADWSGFFHGTMTCHWASFAFPVMVLWQIQEKLSNAVRRYCSESITAKIAKVAKGPISQCQPFSMRQKKRSTIPNVNIQKMIKKLWWFMIELQGCRLVP